MTTRNEIKAREPSSDLTSLLESCGIYLFDESEEESEVEYCETAEEFINAFMENDEYNQEVVQELLQQGLTYDEIIEELERQGAF